MLQVSSAEKSSGLTQVGQNIVAFNAQRIDLDVHRGRGVHGLASAQTELGLMQRTFHTTVFQISVGQQGILMGTDVVGQVELVIQFVQGQFLAFPLDCQVLFVVDGIGLGYFYPVQSCLRAVLSISQYTV